MRSTRIVAGIVVAALMLTGCGLLAPVTGPDIAGCPWGYEGGTAVVRETTEVQGTELDPIYLTERYSLKAYRFKVPEGRYTVRMHFAETYERITAAGQRVYTVSVEGEPVLADLDPFKEAGAQFTAVVKECETTVADGELTVTFADKMQNPMINGLEVIAPGGSAIRVNCGSALAYTDPHGRLWHKDQPLPTP
ncbi:MAG: malectin domain-containing carbohydrate-binding protein [Planctomycetota bacterium]